MDRGNYFSILNLKLHILAHMNVTSIEKLLATAKPLVLMGEPKTLRRPVNVPSVEKAFPTNQNSLDFRESTEVSSPMATTNRGMTSGRAASTNVREVTQKKNLVETATVVKHSPR